jgi:hypothetical protein
MYQFNALKNTSALREQTNNNQSINCMRPELAAINNRLLTAVVAFENV